MNKRLAEKRQLKKKKHLKRLKIFQEMKQCWSKARMDVY